jgi:hypothetical protein
MGSRQLKPMPNRVMGPVSPQKPERRRISCKRREADCAHRERAGQRSVGRVPDNRSDDPQPEYAHGDTLGERSRGPIAKCHADHDQPSLKLASNPQSGCSLISP